MYLWCDWIRNQQIFRFPRLKPVPIWENLQTRDQQNYKPVSCRIFHCRSTTPFENVTRLVVLNLLPHLVCGSRHQKMDLRDCPLRTHTRPAWVQTALPKRAWFQLARFTSCQRQRGHPCIYWLGLSQLCYDAVTTVELRIPVVHGKLGQSCRWLADISVRLIRFRSALYEILILGSSWR